MLIAVSGGADSVALLLHQLELGNVEAVAHCNFMLRGSESDRDEAFVKRLCNKFGVRLFVRRFDTIAEAHRTGESIEMAARRLRYEWFERLAAKEGYQEIAVAHHREDNAETLLLNLLRGSGIRGLTGMRPRRGLIVRPLLDWSKADILDYLRRKGQDYVTDSSNNDTHYRRNYLRHNIIPALQRVNPSVVSTLHATAIRLAEAEALYQLGIDACRQRFVTERSDGGLEIDRNELLRSQSAATLLHEWCAPYGFSESQTNDALEMKAGSIIENENFILTRTANIFVLGRFPKKVDLRIPLDGQDRTVELRPSLRLSLSYINERKMLPKIDRDPEVATFDLDCIVGNLYLRGVQSGDRFAPFGMKGTKLVSDYLTNLHLNRIDRLATLLLLDDNGPLWIVGRRIDARGAINDNTRRILQLRIQQV